MIIIILLCIILFIINVFLCYKYFIIKKAVKSYEDIGTGKYGYYKTPKVIVYIKELDRYLNGYSKITIDKIEATTKYDKQTYIAEEKKSFPIIKINLRNRMVRKY